jgi:acyl-coenzyme A synthetase/AMP-(fatty) acid ligase
LGSIGKPIPNVDLRVLREDGTPCGHGEDGELVARGSTIMSGYWGAPDETARALSPHGYYTGDIGRRDSDGFFWVTGRKRDMIKAGAHRIAAQEIEHAILEYPEVHETAVIGVPDDILGEAIRAFVVFRGEPSGQLPALLQFLHRRLPAFKIPSFVEPVPSLPKNESGKVMKQALRQWGSPNR